MIDEMKIGTNFMRSMVSKIIGSAVKRKLGYDVGVRLNDFTVKIDDENAHLHLNIDCDMSQQELAKILSMVGLG